MTQHSEKQFSHRKPNEREKMEFHMKCLFLLHVCCLYLIHAYPTDGSSYSSNTHSFSPMKWLPDGFHFEAQAAMWTRRAFEVKLKIMSALIHVKDLHKSCADCNESGDLWRRCEIEAGGGWLEVCDLWNYFILIFTRLWGRSSITSSGLGRGERGCRWLT